MANLTDKAINNTYQSLLKTIDNTEINGSTEISDGLGNGTGITISNDGQITTDGTISFGTLKDAGENISISKFVDESDGIANNDNDTSIPTSAAVVDYVENKITLDDLDFTADTGSGSVDLDSQTLNINGGTNVTTEATGQTVTINATGTNLSSTSTSTVVNINSSTGGNTSISSATSTNAGVLTSSDKDKLDGISSGAEVNPASTDNLSEGTSNLYYTDARVSANTDVAANTDKVGITTQQASDITTNNAKVGITTDQADAITANTAKNSYPSADSTKVGFISITQAVDLDTIESDVTTNNAKVGITSQQATDITTNNAKISFDSASSTKLSGIEAGAEVNPTASEIKTSYESNADTNAFTDAEQTKLSGIATGATNVTDNSQIANGAGYTTNTGTVTEVTVGTALGVTNGTTTPNITLDTANLYKVIGTATDHSSRVTLDGGVAEGATSIMKNLETLIFN
jgi:hypothetical protein